MGAGPTRLLTLAPDVAAEVQALDYDTFGELWEESTPAERPALFRARARTDLEILARTCFADRFELDWSPVHSAFLLAPKTGWRERKHQEWTAWVAPRGGAKSSFRSFLTIVHDVAYGLEACICMFSTSYQLSEALVTDLFEVFTKPDAYPELHALYGPFKVSGTKTAFSVSCPTGDPKGTQILAMSFGGTIRGHKFAGVRPTKFCLDDTVHPKHVKSAEQRDGAWSFLQKDIGRAGWTYTVVDLVGTIQHADDLVARAVTSPKTRFRVRQWANLIAWPTNTGLWDACRALWANLADPEREDTARAFYVAHKAAMDEGAEVLWPEGRPLFEIMLTFWSEPAAFWSEDQNQPRDPTTSLFNVDREDEPGLIRRCTFDGRTIRPSQRPPLNINDCTVAIWLDSSKGKAKSDYPAICVVARDRDGWRYWLRCDLTRRQPTIQHQALWATWEHFAGARPKVGFDATGTQDLAGEAMERIREDRRRNRQPWDMDLRAYEYNSSTGSAVDLITEWEPALTNGWVEVATDLPAEAWAQLRDFTPTGRGTKHDDALAAAERADWLLSSSLPTVGRARGLGG